MITTYFNAMFIITYPSKHPNNIIEGLFKLWLNMTLKYSDSFYSLAYIYSRLQVSISIGYLLHL